MVPPRTPSGANFGAIQWTRYAMTALHRRQPVIPGRAPGGPQQSFETGIFHPLRFILQCHGPGQDPGTDTAGADFPGWLDRAGSHACADRGFPAVRCGPGGFPRIQCGEFRESERLSRHSAGERPATPPKPGPPGPASTATAAACPKRGIPATACTGNPHTAGGHGRRRVTGDL